MYTKIIFKLLFLLAFTTSYGQNHSKVIVGKWNCQKRDFIDPNNKNKITKSQKLPYTILYEFRTNLTGADYTVNGQPSEFKYEIRNDTLYYGRLIATIDTLTKDKLTITEPASGFKSLYSEKIDRFD